MTDEFDDKAAELLPCSGEDGCSRSGSTPVTHDGIRCPAEWRAEIAAALRAERQKSIGTFQDQIRERLIRDW